MPKKIAAIDRFRSYVSEEDGCLVFLGALNWGGYGKFWLEGKTIAAHKYAYEQAYGPIPDGLTIDHLCRTRHCVKPEHLEAVTIQVNLSRAVNRPEKRTHCPSGHEYTPENTYWVTGKGRTYRSCKECSHQKYEKRKLNNDR